jgi:DNA polymerase elongation subunit (family B)
MILTTVDLETVQPDWMPPPDDPDKFPPLYEHVVAVAGYQVVNLGQQGKDTSFELHADICTTSLKERAAIADLGDVLRHSDRIITWNGRGFDMPLLGLRAMHHGLSWNFWPNKRHRYGNYKQPLVHFDLMDQLTDNGAAYGLKLDGVARLAGLPGKYDVTASEVSNLWPDLAADVARYCAEDVVQTWLIYLQWCRTFRGWTTVLENVERQWWEWAREQEILAQLIELYDKGRTE